MTINNATLTDDELVKRVASGDKSAIRLLFHRHHARVFRFVARQTRSEAIADEVANEVFLEVWRQAGKFEFRSEVTTWLLGIARFKALSRLRKRTEEELEDGVADAIADAADNPEDIAMKAGKAAIIRRLVDALAAEHRVVIDLAYYQGRSVGEIGEILAIPAATVKTRMFYARKKLGEALAAAGQDRGWP